VVSVREDLIVPLAGIDETDKLSGPRLLCEASGAAFVSSALSVGRSRSREAIPSGQYGE
jgi:hypothetical protein